MNAESQLHSCGYSHGAALVHPPISFRRRILPACATSSSCSSEIFPHECVRTRRSACVTIVIYSSGDVDGVSSMYFLHVCERSQVDVGVAKLYGRDLFLGFDQWDRAPQVPSPIDRHGRQDPPVLPVERYEAPLFRTAAYDELVPFGVEPGVLEVMLVLIGPEPGDLIVRLVLSQHVPGRRRSLLQGVLPVLDADVALEYGVIVVGHITSRVDPLHTRPAVLVDHDTVVDLHAGTSEHIRDRLDAQAHHNKVALDALAALSCDPLHALGTLERSHLILEDQLRPVVAVDLFDHPTNLLA